MNSLNIITVGYNEEINLPKLFKSLEYIKSQINIRHIYVDQSSIDNSVKISKENGCEVYIHENKGYADPDKKWIVENLIQDEDWCLILDCDEELSKELSDEIILCIKNVNYNIYNLHLSTCFLGIKNGTFTQPRLFKKNSITITNEIHKYIQIKPTSIIGELSTFIVNNDLKMVGNEISSLVIKQLKYAENETIRFEYLSNSMVIFNMIWKPILWFFGWGIKHKLFIKGTAGFIYCINMAFYQFTIFALIYEKRKKKNII